MQVFATSVIPNKGKVGASCRACFGAVSNMCSSIARFATAEGEGYDPATSVNLKACLMEFENEREWRRSRPRYGFQRCSINEIEWRIVQNRGRDDEGRGRKCGAGAI